MADINGLQNSLVNSANGPAEVSVAGMGQSREHSLIDQLKVLTALASAAAGPRAGIQRVGLRVGSPTGLRFNTQEETCR